MTRQAFQQLPQRGWSREYGQTALNGLVCRHSDPARERRATRLFPLPQGTTAIRDERGLDLGGEQVWLGTTTGDEIDSSDVPLTHCFCAQPLENLCAMSRCSDFEIRASRLEPDALPEIGEDQLGARGLLLQGGRAQLTFYGSRKLLGDAHRQRGEVVIAQAKRLITGHGQLRDTGKQPRVGQLSRRHRLLPQRTDVCGFRQQCRLFDQGEALDLSQRQDRWTRISRGNG